MRQRAIPLLLLLAACSRDGARELRGVDVAPKLALPTADGGRFDPAVLAGKRVLVNFWTPG